MLIVHILEQSLPHDQFSLRRARSVTAVGGRGQARLMLANECEGARVNYCSRSHLRAEFGVMQAEVKGIAPTARVRTGEARQRGGAECVQHDYERAVSQA